MFGVCRFFLDLRSHPEQSPPFYSFTAYPESGWNAPAAALDRLRAAMGV